MVMSYPKTDYTPLSLQISSTTFDYMVEEILTINSVTEEDVGNYYCKVTYPQGTQISQAATLTILG